MPVPFACYVLRLPTTHSFGKNLKYLGLIIGVIAAFGLFGSIAFRVLIGGNNTSWHQRLTVIIDTPNGKVSGASVVEITKTNTSGTLVPPEARGMHGTVRGEAVAIEVLPRRWLFALLSGDGDSTGDAGQLVYSAFQLGKDRKSGIPTAESNMADLRARPLDTPVPIPTKAYPLLVTFDNVSKPETVREVDPTNLAATFGPGVTLSGMTLEITEEAVTAEKLEDLLTWLCDHKSQGIRLSGKTGAVFDNELPNNLGPGNFSVGGCK